MLPMVFNSRGHWGWCRVKSEWLYGVCKLLHISGDFRINVMQFVGEDGGVRRGHAWVTRNGREVWMTPGCGDVELEMLGENGRYCYWVAQKKGCRKGK